MGLPSGRPACQAVADTQDDWVLQRCPKSTIEPNAVVRRNPSVLRKFKVRVAQEMEEMAQETENRALFVLQKTRRLDYTKEQVIADMRAWSLADDPEAEFAKAEQTGLIKKAGKNHLGDDIWKPA